MGSHRGLGWRRHYRSLDDLVNTLPNSPSHLLSPLQRMCPTLTPTNEYTAAVSSGGNAPRNPKPANTPETTRLVSSDTMRSRKPISLGVPSPHLTSTTTTTHRMLQLIRRRHSTARRRTRHLAITRSQPNTHRRLFIMESLREITEMRIPTVRSGMHSLMPASTVAATRTLGGPRVTLGWLRVVDSTRPMSMLAEELQATPAVWHNPLANTPRKSMLGRL